MSTPDISQMYNDIANKARAEKTASDQGNGQQTDPNADEVVLDKEFFGKFASGDPEALSAIERLTQESVAAGFSEEQINTALQDAAREAGVDFDEMNKIAEANGVGDPEVDPDMDPYEMAKIAAYTDGEEKAIADVLESDLAKQAGITIDDLAEYELGTYFGQGYYEKRAELDAAIEKIADSKGKAAKGFMSRMAGHVSDAAKRSGQLLAGGRRMGGVRPGNNPLRARRIGTGGTAGGKAIAREALKSHGARGLAAVGAGGLGYGGYRAATSDKKK